MLAGAIRTINRLLDLLDDVYPPQANQPASHTRQDVE
jgi:hypothetical protein